MGKFRKIFILLMIPVALILALEGISFYSRSGFSSVEVFLCTVENSLMAFIARPSLRPYDAFFILRDSYTLFERLIAKCYGVVLIIAPILTTGALIAGFRVYILEFKNSLRISFKEKYYVIGDGTTARKIAKKYAKKYHVHFLLPMDTPADVRAPLLKNNITAFNVDYTNILSVLKGEKIEKAAAIILNFNEWFDNCKIVTDIIEYLVQYTSDEPTPTYIIDAPPLYKEIFDNLYKGLCIKHGKSESTLKVTFINVNERNAKDFFKNPELTVQPENKHHILFTGIGSYGRPLLTQLIRYMLQNGLWGTIEIFDRDMGHRMNELVYQPESVRANKMFRNVETVTNARMTAEYKSPAGVIRLNYYQASVGEYKYTEYLEKIIQDGKFTETFFCIGDTTLNFECYRLLQNYTSKDDDVRLFFRAGPELVGTFEAMELAYDKVRHLPDGVPDIELE